MNKILSFCFAVLVLVGCVTGASIIKDTSPAPKGEIIEQMTDEMLELAKEMDQERSPAIYVVVISEPVVITAKPPEK